MPIGILDIAMRPSPLQPKFEGNTASSIVSRGFIRNFIVDK
jgi:hypothetical protein